jgi:hypothetical protein
MDYNQIRIREGKNATIREIHVSPEKIERMNQRFKKFGSSVQRKLIINQVFGSPCCICGEIPSMEIIYKLQDATRIERYCDPCITKVYEREQVL